MRRSRSRPGSAADAMIRSDYRAKADSNPRRATTSPPAVRTRGARRRLASVLEKPETDGTFLNPKKGLLELCVWNAQEGSGLTPGVLLDSACKGR